MGETLTGLANITKHFGVSTKTIQTWLLMGMPHLNSAGVITVSIEAAEKWAENYRNYGSIFDGNFQVQIIRNGNVLWAHGMENGCRCGLNNATYYKDGTFEHITAALDYAAEQAKSDAELVSRL